MTETQHSPTATVASKAAATPPAEYGPLVATCEAWGIKRNSAFELARAGLIDVFKIGAKPYVTIASLRSLPDRLAAQQQTQQ